jgi:UDP-N-acetylglucosamine--N-acetylmuramyl-(pentapeptide) pyrophosphoryl-undecaprenol N-acetylglucosamine transferase
MLQNQKSSKVPVIVLTGGGSGGHITPLLSLARELKSQSPGCQLIYIGHKGDGFDTFKQSGHDFDFMAFINAGKFRRYYGKGIMSGVFNPRTLALNIRDFFRIPGSVVVAWRILGKFKPDAVFSKGSFVALPVCLAAKLRGIPIITHDSDAMPGLANRIIGRWAKIQATGMPAEYYSYPQNTISYVGIPIDERIKKVTPKIQSTAKSKLKLPADSTVLLLSGGGNGSQKLNDMLLAIAKELLETNLSLYIVHLTGRKHEEVVKAAYKALPKLDQKRVITTGYSNEFYLLSAAADLVITRAGATTLADLAAAGKACVIIPAPFLAGGHQLKNSNELVKKDAAVVLEESVGSDELLAVVNSLLANDTRRFELAKNLFATGKPDASRNLSKLILNIAAEKN